MNTFEHMNPRIPRGEKPKKKLTRWNYRQAALLELRRDFHDCCAYSMQHMSRAGGLIGMEVDHFDPRRKNDVIQDYENLFLASGHCNRFKGDYWPTEVELAVGIRLLNPCQEQDYGEHIFEDPTSHELVGTTVPGRNQIVRCDLDAPHFLDERRERSEILSAIKRAEDLTPKSSNELSERLRKVVSLMIPEIPPPPAGYNRNV